MTQSLRSWLRRAPFTLALSSGYFGFFAHCGVVSVLEEEDLRPAAITGASAGALIGACWAAGCPARRLTEILFALTKKDFWDPALGMGLLRGDRFRTALARVSPVPRLEDCPIPIGVSTFDPIRRSNRVWSRGPLPDCVYASCTVPLLFQPIRLEGRFYLDGGILDRLGLAGAQSGARVLLHHLPLTRIARAPALCLPRRNGMVAVTPWRLQPVGPSRLQAGTVAFRQAVRAMRTALGMNLDRRQHLIVPV